MNTQPQNRTNRIFHGARGEESALFRVSAMPAQTGAAAGATAESSGYIDVHALARPPQDLSPGAAACYEAARRLESRRAGTRGPRRSAERTLRRGLQQGLLATLALSVIGLVAGVAKGRDASPPTIEVMAPAAPDRVIEVPLLPAAPAIAFDDRILDDAELTALAPEEEAAPVPATAPPKSTRARKSTAKKATPPATRPEPTPTPVAQPKKATEPELPREMSVECLLNPQQCKAPAKPTEAKPTMPAGPSLPERLDLAQLKDGSSKARAAAERQCKDLARPGEKVQVKLSIAGATGKVVSSSVLGSKTKLATCVADTLADARFDRSRATQQGTVVTVRF
ncbi:MAG: hypothetical protein KC636_39820 [Myxococcales bacterium]|nr:hypothetical protein [Myxococcales bacterium]